MRTLYAQGWLQKSKCSRVSGMRISQLSESGILLRRCVIHIPDKWRNRPRSSFAGAHRRTKDDGNG